MDYYHQVPKYIIQDELTSIVQKERNGGDVGSGSGKFNRGFIPRHLTICNQSRETIYFSEQSETLYYIDTRRSSLRNNAQETTTTTKPLQKILKNDDLVFRNIKQISYNNSGNRLLIITDYDINVLYIPEYKSADSEIINATTEFSLSLLKNHKHYTSGSTNSSSGRTNFVKVCWHPLSDNHLVALDSDSIIRIIQVSTGKIEEIPILMEETNNQPISSFSFGSKKSWERFTIFLTTTSQSLYALCPIIPSGCVVSERFLIDLVTSCQQDSLLMVKNFLSGIVLDVTTQSDDDNDEERKVTLKSPSNKECHALISRLIPIHNQQPSNESDMITDMITVNQNNSNLQSCLVTVNSCGVVHLFAITDTITPMWKVSALKIAEHPYVIEAACLQQVLPGVVVENRLAPYLTLHPLSIETVYCIHERGANEITFPFISTMFSDETFDETQLQKTISCPLFISTELVESPKGFDTLHDILYGTTIFYIENKNQRVLISAANIPITYDNEDDTSASVVYSSQFSTAIDTIMNQLHKPSQISKSWNKLEIPFMQVSENTTVADELITFTLQKLKNIAAANSTQQQTLEKLTKLDIELRESQHNVDDKCKKLYDKHKELHERIKRIYDLVFIKELNKEEKQFIKDISEKDRVLNAYNHKLESTKRLMETNQHPIIAKQENYSPEIMEKITTYLDKTSKILEATREEIISIKQK